MTKQIPPYPTWPVFWKFTLCSILIGVMTLLLTPWGYILLALSITSTLFLLAPVAILTSILVVLLRLYRNATGVFIATLIYIISGIMIMAILFGWTGFFSNIENTYIIIISSMPPAFITSLITLPAKSNSIEKEKSP
jgi:hypothetical protein